MKHLKLFESYILEKNRIEYLQDMFPTIDPNTFYNIASIDPTPNKKYLQWLLGQYKRGFSLKGLRDYLLDFKGDIHKFNVDDLKKLSHSEFKTIYNSSSVDIIQPLTFSASKKYGSDKWCVSVGKIWWNKYVAEHKKKIYFITIKDNNILEKLSETFKDNSFVFLTRGEDIEKNNVTNIDDYSKIGVCFVDNGLELWIKPNYLLDRKLNYKFLSIIGIENVILKD